MKKIVILLTSIMIIIGMIAHNAASLIQRVEESRKIGYLNMENFYVLDNASFRASYKDIPSFIEQTKQEFDTFTVIIRVNGFSMGIYVHNEKWEIPLIKGRSFTKSEYLSKEPIYISNRLDYQDITIGIPLRNDKNVYQNALSLEIKDTDMVNVYSSVPVLGLTKSIIEDTRPIFINNLQKLLYAIITIILLSLIYGYYFDLHKEKIAISILCGLSTKEILKEHIFELLYLDLFSFIGSIILFFNAFPSLFMISYYRMELIVLFIKSFLIILTMMGIVLGIIIYKIQRFPVLHVLKEGD